MNFITDKQTLEDLNLLGKYKSDSVFNLFNQVKTEGGEKLLETMFRNPLTDAVEINKRSSTFRFFGKLKSNFPFTRDQLVVVETFLDGNSESNLFFTGINALRLQLLSSLVHDEQLNLIIKGIKATSGVLHTCLAFLTELTQQEHEHPYQQRLQQVKQILKDERLKHFFKKEFSEKLSLFQVAQYNLLLRHTLAAELKKIIEILYEIDVYIAVSKVAIEKDYTYATALSKEANVLTAESLRHPGLKNGIGNPVHFYQDKNLFFLTGANMAGKSTLMKSFGIAVYLAHMGFPIAATKLVFSVKDGLYSSINVSDNLNLGYSHFYAEVLRVKQMAQEVSSGKNLVVIFDELFKGTNVKDAYDATLVITEAFAAYRNCFYIISTHIVEVGEALQATHENMQFAYLPTVMEGSVPRYTYQLKDGITADRQGMIIIENEGILQMLNGSPDDAPYAYINNK